MIEEDWKVISDWIEEKGYTLIDLRKDESVDCVKYEIVARAPSVIHSVNIDIKLDK